MNNKNYFLGLDVGTDSVGYAVTDEQYNLLKFHGEPMWGVHLFEGAKNSAERRGFRTARRRLERRKQRVDLLQELFAEEIAKVDEKFFIRMEGSRLFREDMDGEGTIFGKEGYTDKKYHEQYPTIHHLINELSESNEPHDIRLVYLACAWLVTHRGHFLNDIDVNNIDKVTDFTSVYNRLIDYMHQSGITVLWEENNVDVGLIKDAIKEKTSITKKYKDLCEVLFGTPKVSKESEESFISIDILLKMICGYDVKANDLFRSEEYSEIDSFSLHDDDESLAQKIAQIGDEAELIVRAKEIYDWSLLDDSLDNESSISKAKIKMYEKHRRELCQLKKIIKKYVPDKYDEMFRKAKDDNYVAYSYNLKNVKEGIVKDKASKEEFYDYLKKILKDISPNEEDADSLKEILDEIEKGSYLPKQKNTDNRVIPHQLYLKELMNVLSHAEQYFTFLSQKDKDGFSVTDKIISIFKFRIPYFVGPLNRHSDRSWVVFKKDIHEKILPWNFAEIVDEEESEKAFIAKLTNKCTYYPGKDVLPKGSLLYHKFSVLNEINTLRIDEVPISVEIKQKIYENVFLKQKKVTVKKIEDYLISNNYMEKGQSLSGIDVTVKSDLKPWHDFNQLLQKKILSEQQVEDIILHRTYAEEKARFVKYLDKNYSFLSLEDRKYIASLSYKDFGRLSREFLTEILGVSKETGEEFSIIKAMWETNYNLMELLSDRFTFTEILGKIHDEYYQTNKMSLNERLDSMYISNAVKRPIFRTLDIVSDVVKANGTPPTKIFVEMTRGGKPEQKGKRTKSRKEQILELYSQCEKDNRDLIHELRKKIELMGDAADSKLQSEKLFLYYMQLGKSMYSGKTIDIERLGEKIYDIDHIYPQSMVKDDSIINNKVLVLSEENGTKTNIYPIDSNIRSNMYGFWVMLRDNKFISDEKFKRLTRSTPFSDDEKEGFINRQLTETSQSTKAIAEILKDIYPESEIVYVKAHLTSEFRQEFDLLKSRIYNDLHHAKDAYLNIVTGNVYSMKFSKRWFDVHKEYSVKTKTLFTHEVKCGEKLVWDGEPMLIKVKELINKNNVHLTRYAFSRHEGFFGQMPVKAKEELVPLKKGLLTSKYGGYTDTTVSFFIFVKYRIGKKTDIMLMPVDLMMSESAMRDERSCIEYSQKQIESIFAGDVEDVSLPLGLRRIKINTVISLDGFKVAVSGKSNTKVIVSPNVPFVDSYGTEWYVKKLESFYNKCSQNPNYKYQEEFDKVSQNENVMLYDLYTQKLQRTVFSKRPNNQMKVLLQGRACFNNLSIIDQAKTLLNIHMIFGRLSGGCNLTDIGGSKNAAATYLSLNVSNWRKRYRNVRIIDYSASGLWEKQSENLFDLL